MDMFEFRFRYSSKIRGYGAIHQHEDNFEYLIEIEQ